MNNQILLKSIFTKQVKITPKKGNTDLLIYKPETQKILANITTPFSHYVEFDILFADANFGRVISGQATKCYKFYKSLEVIARSPVEADCLRASSRDLSRAHNAKQLLICPEQRSSEFRCPLLLSKRNKRRSFTLLY